MVRLAFSETGSWICLLGISMIIGPLSTHRLCQCPELQQQEFGISRLESEQYMETDSGDTGEGRFTQ